MSYGQLPASQPALDQPYYGAPFPVAITRFVKKAFVYRGRASRSEYWWVALALAGVTIVFNAISMGFDASDSRGLAIGGVLFGLLSLLVNLALLLPSISLTVRRLHDANFSGFFAFLGLVPFLGPIALIVFACLPSVQQGARFDGTGQYVAPAQAYGQQQGYGQQPHDQQPPAQPYGQQPSAAPYQAAAQPQAPGQYQTPGQYQAPGQSSAPNQYSAQPSAPSQQTESAQSDPYSTPDEGDAPSSTNYGQPR